MGKVVQGIGHAFSSAFGSNVSQSPNAATPVANAFTQSQQSYANGGMNDVLSQLLAGRPGDPTSLSQYFNQAPGAGMVQNLPQSNAQFTPQVYNPQNGSNTYNPIPVNTQFTQPQFQQAALSPIQTGPAQQVQYNNPQFQGTQLTQPNSVSAMQVQSPNVNFNQGPNVLSGMGQQAQLNNVVNPAAQTAALQQVMQRQQDNDIANLRERFGNQGLSSGAMLAESNYRAAAAPQVALASDQITRDNNAQALTQRGQDLANFQGTQGNDTSRLGLGLNQAQGLNNSLLGLSAQGLQAQQGNQNTGVQAQGLSNDALIAFNNQMQHGGDAFNQFQQQNAVNSLNAGGMNQGAALQSQGLNNTATLGMNSQVLNQMQALNAFNQGNSQFGANFGQQGQQLNNNNAQAQNAALMQLLGINNQNQQFGAGLNNQYGLNAAQMGQQNQQFNTSSMLQNQGLGNQFQLGMQNVGLGQQNNQLNAQSLALQQIMNNLRQTQGLGTPQSENVVSPGWGTQALNVAGQIANIGATLNGGGHNQAPVPGAQLGSSSGNVAPANMSQFSLPPNLQTLGGNGFNFQQPPSFQMLGGNQLAYSPNLWAN